MGARWHRQGRGDDPDVTHGALIVACVSRGAPGSGVTFSAGPGVGTVSAGLPIPPGEPAINPVPRAMIRDAVREAAELFGEPVDIAVEISIPGGEKIAERTLNARLGVIEAFRSSAPPASSSPIPAQPQSTPSIAASTSRAPQG